MKVRHSSGQTRTRVLRELRDGSWKVGEYCTGTRTTSSPEPRIISATGAPLRVLPEPFPSVLG
jgi:hypothetical protein